MRDFRSTRLLSARFNGETGARPFVPNWPANLATERTFIAFLRGRANVAPVQPSSSRPNYPAESLNDPQARDINAYIRSFKSAPPPVERIPTMGALARAAGLLLRTSLSRSSRQQRSPRLGDRKHWRC
jgi:hypothetical protein